MISKSDQNRHTIQSCDESNPSLEIDSSNIINQRSIVENLTLWDRESLIWACNCTTSEKLTLMSLNLYADENGECQVPSQVIAYRCRIMDIDPVIKSLQEHNLIAKSDRFQILFQTMKKEIES